MHPERFLEGITLGRILPCIAEPEKVIAVGEPSDPLDDVLPFLLTSPT